MTKKISTIIFDLGNVLIRWDPLLLYNKIFQSEEEARRFIDEVCTGEWNAMQDKGRPFSEGVEVLSKENPHLREYIQAYADRWEEMLGGLIEGSHDILRRLHQTEDYQLLALTNWSTETFPVARERYDIWKYFDGILVSGEEKMIKPEPEIYQLLMERYDVVPAESVFIDDSLANVEAARSLGMEAIHFKDPEDLKLKLESLNVKV